MMILTKIKLDIYIYTISQLFNLLIIQSSLFHLHWGGGFEMILVEDNNNGF